MEILLYAAGFVFGYWLAVRVFAAFSK